MDIMQMLKKIDGLKAKIDTFRPFSKELLTPWQERLRIDWTYNSNAIEGNSLTYGETAFFLREGLTSEGKPLKDYVEAKNHAEAIDYLHEIVLSKRMITESFIKELHGLLLREIESTVAKGSNGKLIHKPLSSGKYKTRPNHVLTLSGTIHKYTEPIKIPDEMQSLLVWLKNNKMHPVKKAALFHYRFVCIHPFDDGNGRMARLLMNLILMQEDYPPCVIHNTKRKEYLKNLEHSDATGSTNEFLDFISNELIETQQIMLKALQGKPLPSVPDEKLHRDERRKIIIKTIGNNTFSISQISNRLSRIKRPTLKSDLSALLLNKSIKKKGVGKGVVYYL
ncbi:MAG: Fic family protein [Candidatus Peribacteraceae bacterium]|nr:Fic family protein [Candidatus Peribacteraceae bacterium]